MLPLRIKKRGLPLEKKLVQRRYDLDWLRVLAFAGVFLYHCSRFFAAGDWNIKNATTSPLVETLKGIFDLWGMPLIFVISGASIFFALRPSGVKQFLLNRVWRLLVPLPFGILVLAPPQIYLDRLTHGEFQGSFLEFLPLYFRDWNIWGGNFAWSGSTFGTWRTCSYSQSCCCPFSLCSKTNPVGGSWILLAVCPAIPA